MSRPVFGLVPLQIRFNVASSKEHIAPRLCPGDFSGPPSLFKPGLRQTVQSGQLLSAKPILQFRLFPPIHRRRDLLAHYLAKSVKKSVKGCFYWLAHELLPSVAFKLPSRRRRYSIGFAKGSTLICSTTPTAACMLPSVV